MATEVTEIKAAPPTTSRRGAMFRALSHRNYRLFWSGAFLSNIGTWMQAVAQGWLVLQLTDSPFWLGLDGFVALLTEQSAREPWWLGYLDTGGGCSYIRRQWQAHPRSVSLCLSAPV